MSRPNPEQVFEVRSESYRAWNGSSSRTTSVKAFNRIWGGSNSPGFPGNIVYNYHSSENVRDRFGTFNSYRYFPNNPRYWDSVDFVMNGAYGTTVSTPSTQGRAWGAQLPDRDDQRSIESAMDRVLDQKSNLAQFIAERGQVADQIASTAKRLADVILALRRGDYSRATRALGLRRDPKGLSGQIANDWLAYQYGWKPLLSDVKGIAEHLARNTVGNPIRITARGRAKTEFPSESLSGLAHDGAGNVLGPTRITWHTGTIEWKTKLEFIVENDFLRQGQQLGISDPLTLAWELLPYSFVVDWFLPVGDFLQRINYDSGLIYKGGCTTTFKKHGAVVSGSGSVPYQGTGVASLSGSTSFEAYSVVRRLHVIAPRPKLPHFQDPFSATHALNALALMRTAFGR